LASHVVTGGAGFIGSHIAEALAARGDHVIVLDDFSTGKPENLKPDGASVDVRSVDLARDPLAEHLRDVDTVFHHAAIVSVPLSVEDPLRTHDVNVNGSLNLFLAARDAGVRRVICASSSAVYGDDPALPKSEQMMPAPVSPYGAQKAIMEVYGQTFFKVYGLETVSLRYFNVFGPRQDASSPYSGVFARFIPAVLRGERPIIFGDGLQSRDFVSVADVVDANLKASAAELVAGEVINIAGGVRTTVQAVFDQIKSLTGSDVDPVFEAPRPGDLLHSHADLSKANRLLEWKPGTRFRGGLEKTIDWYRQSL
jgi:nucleoside-diphosphate-sugar epimerase